MLGRDARRVNAAGSCAYGAGAGAGGAGSRASDECQCVHFQPSSPLRSTTVLRDGCDIVLPSGIVALKSNSTVQ